jgi:putative transposase
MKYRFIHDHRLEFRVEKMCNVLGVSRSGYYAWIDRPVSRRDLDDEKLLFHIKQIHKESNGTYGILRMTKELQKRNTHCGKNRVAKVMRKNHIICRTQRKYKATTNSNHNYPTAPNLLDQNFKVEQPNVVWVGDITYIGTEQGWLYLAAVEDLFNRKVVGWSMSDTMPTELTASALEMAIGRRNPSDGLIFHSDRGAQYASYKYQQLLRNNKMIQSMSCKGNCYDNACVESFFATLKKELIYGRRFKTRAEAKQAVTQYIETWYNSRRLHSSLGYVSPNEFECNYHNQSAVA